MVHVEHVAVGQQRVGGGIILGKVAAEHQGRLEYRPQVHHRVLLVAGEIGPAFLPALAADADLAQREHVGVGPCARGDIGRPLGANLELVVQLAPVVPEVVHRAPHVGVRLHVVHLLHRCLARGDAQHDGTPAMVDGLADHLDFSRVVRAGEVVYLHEVHPPLGIQLEAGVIVFLGPRLAVVHLVVVAEPRAGRVVAGNHVAGDAVCAFHRELLLCRHFGQAAHQMDAELQPLAVHVVGQGTEAHAVGGGGEAVERGGIAAVLVIHVDGIGLVVAAGLVVLHEPADVHHHVLPAVGGQMLRHVVRIGLHFALHHGRPVAVPRVPTHRRGQCPFLEREFTAGLRAGTHGHHAGHGP